MDTGALVGMILGVIGGLLLLAGLIAFWIIRRRKAASKKDSKLSKPGKSISKKDK
jgi:nitrate reductase gamma subunit